MIELVKGNRSNLRGKATIYSKLDNRKMVSKYITTDISEFPASKRDRYRAISLLYNLMKELRLNPSRFPYNSTGFTLGPIIEELRIQQGSEDIVYVGEHKTFDLCTEKISSGELSYLAHFWRQSANKDGLSGDVNPFEPKKIILRPSDLKDNELPQYLLKRYISPILSARERRDYNLVGILKKSLESFLDNPHHAQDALDLSSIFEKDAITDLDKDLIYSIVSKISAVNTENYELAEEIKDRIFCLKKGYRV